LVDTEDARMRDIVGYALAAAAILTALPAGAATVAERLVPCLACHGDTGTSATADVPSLGAQPDGYVLVQLYSFREKLRKVELMNEMAKGLTDDDLRAFSVAIAKLPPPQPVADAGDPARIARAKDLVGQHRCNFCHAAQFQGQDQVPRIAGQREDYLVRTLREYKSGDRHGYDPAMASVVTPLTDQDFADLAYFMARQK
jgi:cytochrome c553